MQEVESPTLKLLAPFFLGGGRDTATVVNKFAPYWIQCTNVRFGWCPFLSLSKKGIVLSFKLCSFSKTLPKKSVDREINFESLLLSVNWDLPKPTLVVFFQTIWVNLSVSGVNDSFFQSNFLFSSYHRFVARAPVKGEPALTEKVSKFIDVINCTDRSA